MLIQLREETSTRARVLGVYYQYGEELTQRIDTLEVQEVPSPDPIKGEGKKSVLYYNPTDKTFFYEYSERALTTEEEVTNLKATVDTLSLEILKIRGLA
jgi:hypothetical protein